LKYLVLRRSCGWGARMESLIESIKYCEETGRILVIDHWKDRHFSNYYKDGINKHTFDLYFELDNIDYLTYLPPNHGNTYAPEYWDSDKVHNDDLMHTELEDFVMTDYFVYLHHKSKRVDFDEDVVVHAGGSYTIHYDNLENHPRIKSLDIKLKRNVTDIVDDFCEKNDIENLIGIHGRHSPLFDTLEGNRLKFPAKAIIKTKKLIKGEKVFLATDSWRIKKIISEVAEVVDYKKHIKLTDIADWDDSVWCHSVDYADNERKGLEALVDCLILARCKEFMPLNKWSSFSKLAKIFRIKGL